MCSTHPAQDITVIFDDEAATEIRTHSVLLMLASPVFHKMFTQEMKEKQSHRIELPGKSPEEFKVLLDFLEPGTGRLQKISDANVGFLSRWSDEYCMESLHTECIDFIKEQPATVPRVVLAHCLGLRDYATSCIDHLLRSGQTDWKERVCKCPMLVHFAGFQSILDILIYSSLLSLSLTWLLGDGSRGDDGDAPLRTAMTIRSWFRGCLSALS